MSSLSRELALQFLDEEKLKEAVPKLEQESGFFFNMKYFEDEVEKYLSGFTKVDDNRYSMKIFLEVSWKQKYLEGLDKQDRPKAVEILVTTLNEELFKEITQLLTLENYRESEQLSKYGDTKSVRAIMLVELKKLIEANQSLNWQHQLCKNPKPNPDMKTPFVDHSYRLPNDARAPSPVNIPPSGAHGPFQPTPSPVRTALAGCMSSPSSVAHPAVSAGAIPLRSPSIQEFTKKTQRRRSAATLVFFFLALCFSLTVGIETPTPVVTINSPDGDVIDCISINEQPAFGHPLLKNHKLQEIPTGMIYKKENFGWQVWHSNGAKCPQGSIPIRKAETNVPHTKYGSSFPYDAADRATSGHHYAIAYFESHTQIYGTRATINVWDPVVEAPDDFSLAQIWLASGSYETNNLNTVEAGWQVYQNKYGDKQPRLFTYWTINGYQGTGCYSLHCAGFVQISSTIALEAAISRKSTFGGDQYDITIQIWKDQFSGNWWLGIGVNVVPVGYWPAEIFTIMSDHAVTLEWGGEVLYRNSSGLSTITQMGSGEFGDKGFRKSAYFCNLKVAEGNHTYLPVQNFTVRATNPNWYTIKKSSSQGCGNHFHYGGPGPMRSTAAPRLLPSFSFFMFFAFLVVV